MTGRDIWQSLGARFVVVALGTSSSILLTRALGPEGRGLYIGVMNVAMLAVQLGTLGLASSNTYYLSGRRESGQALATNTITISLVVGGVLAIAGWFIAGQVHALRESAGTVAVVVALACIPVNLLMLFGQNFQLATHDVRGFNRIEVARNLGALLLVIGLVWLGHGNHTTALYISLTTTGVAMVWLWRRLSTSGAMRLRLGWDGGVFRRTFGYGLKAYVITFLGYLVLRLDALLVQNWRGATAAGHYGVAVQVGDLLLTVSTTVGMIVFPKAAALGAEAWPLVRRITLITAAALGAACLAAYALAPFAIELVFGSAFRPAAEALRYLLPGIWFLSIEILLVQYLNGLGMPIAIIWAWIVALAMNVYLNWLWIPTRGIQGAALASTAAYALVAAFVLLLVVRARRQSGLLSESSPTTAYLRPMSAQKPQPPFGRLLAQPRD